MEKSITKNPFNIIVIVAALGYFVDIYDLTLFGIVKDPSLRDVGIPDSQIIDQGASLLGLQMIGMLIGGIIWGIMGDKKGRLSVLFFTILLYSIANIANGYVHNITEYSIVRFLAGVGLAGELGVGITLVSEVMTKENRGYGTAIVSGVGILGAVLGNLVTQHFGWRNAYFTGGGLGMALLVLRIFVYESGMFEKLKEEKKVNRGNILSLFNNMQRFKKYLYSILIGIPVWYVIGILVFFSPQLAKNAFHIKGAIIGGKSVMYHYIGASIGSFVISIISQRMQSRKKALFISLTTLSIFLVVFFCLFNASTDLFYVIMFMLGIAQGYWAVFVTTASEQFGTNLRATVTTTVPNFVRGITFLLAMSFKALGKPEVLGLRNAALYMGIVVMAMSFFALYHLQETYGKDLDYIETI